MGSFVVGHWFFPVALRKESVDRNGVDVWIGHLVSSSLSARRAWIEIKAAILIGPKLVVALRKESVDRNYPPVKPFKIGKVALRKESVDRNHSNLKISHTHQRRSPQGERG